MSDYPMLISNKLHSFRNFQVQSFNISTFVKGYLLREKTALIHSENHLPYDKSL